MTAVAAKGAWSGGGPGPLAGVRVLDLTIAAAGPYSTAVLASQGADVIKVERPGGGDFLRASGTTSKGVSSVFGGWNRGKRSICIDFKKPEGRDLLKKLAVDADVLVHNLRPGGAEKLGIGYDDVRAVKPDIIYAVLTGWGETGPRAGAPAYDTVIQAATGFAMTRTGPADAPPQFLPMAVCDKLSGLTLSQLLTAALYSRATTGKGQRLHLSMLHAAIGFLWPDGAQDAIFLDGDDSGGLRASTPPVRRTADGWISISLNQDSEFQALCRLFGLERLVEDPRFAKTGPRSIYVKELQAELGPNLESRTNRELVELFTAHRIPHAVIKAAREVHEDPQVAAIGALEVSVHPEAGRMRLPRPVGDFGGTPPKTPSPAPRVGEHTDAVLRALGLDDASIDALRQSGTVA